MDLGDQGYLSLISSLWRTWHRSCQMKTRGSRNRLGLRSLLEGVYVRASQSMRTSATVETPLPGHLTNDLRCGHRTTDLIAVTIL